MFLIFDTETTGLPRQWNSPPTDTDSWPRLVQIGWETYDTLGKRTDSQCHVIKPDGFIIPDDAARIHGITTAKARRLGRPLDEVLKEFRETLRDSTIVVSHNIQFDESVVQAECIRLGLRDSFGRKMRVCTMRQATDFCRIPGPFGYKWPTLQELHSKLFGKKCSETHDAAADVAICSRCFFELRRAGIIRISVL